MPIYYLGMLHLLQWRNTCRYSIQTNTVHSSNQACLKSVIFNGLTNGRAFIMFCWVCINLERQKRGFEQIPSNRPCLEAWVMLEKGCCDDCQVMITSGVLLC